MSLPLQPITQSISASQTSTALPRPSRWLRQTESPPPLPSQTTDSRPANRSARPRFDQRPAWPTQATSWSSFAAGPVDQFGPHGPPGNSSFRSSSFWHRGTHLDGSSLRPFAGIGPSGLVTTRVGTLPFPTTSLEPIDRIVSRPWRSTVGANRWDSVGRHVGPPARGARCKAA